MKHILFSALFALACCASCGSSSTTEQQDDTTEPQAETRREALEGTRVSFEVPIDYTRSRRYLLEDEIVNYDNRFHAIFEDMLYQLEREDEEPDIFIDTTENFDHFVIRTVSKLELNEERATLYAANLEQYIQERADQTRGLTSERLSTTLNEGNGKTMLKLKYKHENREEPEVFHETIYFITDAVQTFVITEYHRDEADIESAFWRMTY